MSKPTTYSATADSERAEHWRVLRELSHYLWPAGRTDLKARVVTALLSLALAKVVNVGIPLILKQAIDSLVPGSSANLSLTIGLVLAYSAARVLTQLFGEFRDFIFARVSQHSQRVLALQTFEHLHSLSLAFHLDRQTGGLSRVIERGTRGVQTVLSFMLFNILPTLLEVIFVSVILYWNFGAALALVTFVTIITYIAYTLAVTDWRVKFRRTMNQRDTEANTKAIDSLLNYETVKYFSNEKHEYSRYNQALRGYEEAAVSSQTSLSLLNVGQGFIIAIGLAIILWLASHGVANGTMGIGDFVLVNTYLIQLYLPLNFLGFVYRETKQSLVDMDKMFELLHFAKEVEDRPGAPEIHISSGEVRFANVNFAYSPERPILKDVSFVVPPGKTVAIVGASGAGKSTISRLLFRFYDVSGGSIEIDNQDIRMVTQASLRRAIGIVPQDTVLFNDSIGYNILYGRPTASEDEMKQAAKLAAIDTFVESLQAKYQTPVGERGLKLSGGEKQRVAIARTILKGPKVLIFDEATSALDSRTEQDIQRSLRDVSRERTTLVIAHRLSTIIDADEILVLKDGAIAERGRHGDLLSRGGEYASMWARQAEARRAEETLQTLQAASVKT